MNSKFGFKSLGKPKAHNKSATVSLERIKETIIPLNDYMDDCCYLEEIILFTTDYYLGLDENDETTSSFPFLFFIRHLNRVKAYLILEMFNPDPFIENNFSLLKDWSREREKIGNAIPSFAVINMLFKNIFSRRNELKEDIEKIRVISTVLNFSPIL